MGKKRKHSANAQRSAVSNKPAEEKRILNEPIPEEKAEEHTTAPESTEILSAVEETLAEAQEKLPEGKEDSCDGVGEAQDASHEAPVGETIEEEKLPNPVVRFLSDVDWEQLVMRCFAAYFFALTLISRQISVKFIVLDYVNQTDTKLLVGLTALMAVVFSLITLYKPLRKSGGYLLLGGVLVYALKMLWRYYDSYPTAGIILVVIIIAVWLVKRGHLDALRSLSRLQCIIFASVAAAVVIGYVIAIGIMRYHTYGTSCYDFGIFNQMYYYMKETLLPYTTCERGKYLSHFAIHVSPIFYLLLPIYAIFPYAQTLIAGQAIVVFSGVIPLWLICKKYKLSNPITLCAALVYIFSPALIGASFYDIHENMFLPPLILWLLYFFEKEKYVPMFIFTALVWTVKEDAPIFTVCIALYVILTRKRRVIGLAMLATSLGYFALVTGLLDLMGEGVMEYRFDNMMTDPDAGLVNVVITSLKNPALAIKESFETEKIVCFIEMLLPVAFLPLFPKKISQLTLIMPLFLENLLADYAYQHDIGFQYVYGVAALLIYSSVINLSEMKADSRKIPISAAVCASLLLSVSRWSGKMFYYDSYTLNKDRIETVAEIFDSIPEDASVESSTYFVPQLSQRERIYVITDNKPQWEDPDFFVIKLRHGNENIDARLALLKSRGYTLYAHVDNMIEVYKSPKY